MRFCRILGRNIVIIIFFKVHQACGRNKVLKNWAHFDKLYRFKVWELMPELVEGLGGPENVHQGDLRGQNSTFSTNM